MYRYYEMDIDRPKLRFVNKWYQRLIDRPAYQKNVMIPFGRNLSEWLDQEKVNAGIQYKRIFNNMSSGNLYFTISGEIS